MVQTLFYCRLTSYIVVYHERLGLKKPPRGQYINLSYEDIATALHEVVYKEWLGRRELRAQKSWTY